MKPHATTILITCIGFTAITGSASLAGPFDEPHLNIMPRTADEAGRIFKVTTPTATFSKAVRFETSSAGAATVQVRHSADAFSQPSRNIRFEDKLNFNVGKGFFRKLWVSSPSSTLASDGLGPVYNARSCHRCHIKNGRGHPPEDNDTNSLSMLLRVSIPATEEDRFAEIEGYIASLPDPTYGSQLQDFAVQGHRAEYKLDVSYSEETIKLSSGETASLRHPKYRAGTLGYGPLHRDAMLSPRVAPQMIGLGLLEAIPAADILALADPQDHNGDGISGRANTVWSVEYNQPMLGRFGLKAGSPTLRQQSASAFSGDIGISTPLFPKGAGDCSQVQIACRKAPHGDQDDRGTEVDQTGLNFVTFFSRNLGVPARRNADDPNVLLGKEVFYTTGCTACHQPSFVTHRLADQPEQSFQLIWPYSDMLLHDLGEGLADNMPEGRATGREWRTSPLWGIGLTKQVSGHSYFLHDGRARSLLEAVLWHGGEAKVQRDAVIEMPKTNRDALIKFLESL